MATKVYIVYVNISISIFVFVCDLIDLDRWVNLRFFLGLRFCDALIYDLASNSLFGDEVIRIYVRFRLDLNGTEICGYEIETNYRFVILAAILFFLFFSS